MDIEEVKSRLQRIRELSKNAETAHVMEDELHVAFIEWIASEGTDAQREIATEVLKSEYIDFPRWYA